jgi:hypothetical protein
MADEKKSWVTPKDFFLWLAAMAALYVSVFSFITLVFAYIDYLFPDSLDRGFDPYSGVIRFSIASLVIIFPLFIYLMRLIHEDARKHREKLNLGVRKWLVYLTVFFAGAALIVDLVVLINAFLSGDLTTRFLLKVLVVLLVGGAVFWYFLEEVRGRWETNEVLSKYIAYGLSALVFATVVGGFFIIGSPQTARDMRFDQQRVNDLGLLQSQIVNYWANKDVLPQELDQLVDPITGLTELPTDPQTGAPYEYAALSGLTFELCAEFAHPSGEASYAYEYPVGGLAGRGSFEHEAGRQCFERTIDPDFFDTGTEVPDRGFKPLPPMEVL